MECPRRESGKREISRFTVMANSCLQLSQSTHIRMLRPEVSTQICFPCSRTLNDSGVRCRKFSSIGESFLDVANWSQQAVPECNLDPVSRPLTAGQAAGGETPRPGIKTTGRGKSLPWKEAKWLENPTEMMKDSVKYRIIFVTEMMKEHSVKNGITFCKTGFSFHHEWTSGMGA